jgi:hypothetical protein
VLDHPRAAGRLACLLWCGSGDGVVRQDKVRFAQFRSHGLAFLSVFFTFSLMREDDVNVRTGACKWVGYHGRARGVGGLAILRLHVSFCVVSLVGMMCVMCVEAESQPILSINQSIRKKHSNGPQPR